MDNGPPREVRGSLDGDMVHCVDCGCVFVFAKGRDCPACHAWEAAQAEVVDE